MPRKSNAKRPTPAPRAPRRARAATPAMRRSGDVEARYLRALYDPFNAEPARFPDLLSFPTSVCSSLLRCGLGSQVPTGGGSTDNCLRFDVYPHVGSTSFNNGGPEASKLSYGTTYNLQGKPTARAYYPDPLRGSGASGTGACYANWSTYRTVAMGVRVKNITPVLNRCGAVTVRSTTSASGLVVEDYTFTQIASSRESVVHDASALTRDSQYWIWRPENYTQDVNFTVTGETNFQPVIQFAFSGAAAQQFEVEVVTFYEFVPKIDVEMLFDVASAIGSPARVEMLNSEILQRAGASAPPTASPDFASHIVREAEAVLGPVVDTPGRILHAARRLRQSAVQRVLAP